jgi:2-desacetyl-2-hydroxyethyl bacteriochlorophyllide A dehydrogenase
VKAVLIAQPFKAEFVDIEPPRCGPMDVLVQSHKVGVCRTDLEIFRGEVPPAWVRYPCIPGHEWSGTVVEAGSGITDLQQGQAVVCEGMVPCMHCRRCRSGQTNLCENYGQIGFSRAGGCAEFVAVPRHVLHPLPHGVSLSAAALVEPAACVLRALQRTRPQVGEAIGVIGIGTLGSAALQLSRLFGPRMITAFGIRDEELVFAQGQGADHVVNSRDADAEQETIQLVGDRLDVVIETAGTIPAIDLATRLVRHGGRIATLGIPGESSKLVLPGNRLVDKDVELIASLSYTSAVFTQVVQLVASRLIDLERIVTHRFPTSAFGDAFGLMEHPTGTVAKILLEHHGAN